MPLLNCIPVDCLTPWTPILPNLDANLLYRSRITVSWLSISSWSLFILSMTLFSFLAIYDRYVIDWSITFWFWVKIKGLLCMMSFWDTSLELLVNILALSMLDLNCTDIYESLLLARSGASSGNSSPSVISLPPTLTSF